MLRSGSLSVRIYHDIQGFASCSTIRLPYSHTNGKLKITICFNFQIKINKFYTALQRILFP